MRRQIASQGVAAVAPTFGTNPGVILHYDITTVYRYGLGDYNSDPALRLLALARNLRVLFLRPQRSVLLSQYLKRDAERRAKKNAASRAWNSFFLESTRKLRGAISGARKQESSLYGDIEWLDGCYSAWDAHIHELIDQGAARCVLHVEPALDAEGEPTFRVVTKNPSQPG
jgi:hypothetical protein